MKFSIKKELLLDALSKVSKAISTKNLIPVLAGVKFELKKKELTERSALLLFSCNRFRLLSDFPHREVRLRLQIRSPDRRGYQ